MLLNKLIYGGLKADGRWFCTMPMPRQKISVLIKNV
jgi:hypothetical protein